MEAPVIALGFCPLGAGVTNHSGFGDALGQSSRAEEHGQLLRKTSVQHGVEGSTEVLLLSKLLNSRFHFDGAGVTHSLQN